MCMYKFFLVKRKLVRNITMTVNGDLDIITVLE